MGKPVVMGRNTLESIGGPLPGRKNVVVSRSGAFDHEGIIHATDIDEALSIAARIAKADAAEEIMIVGGGQIYEQVIGRADRLYLTEVDVEVDGHVYFPDYQEHGDWRETSRNSRAAAEARPAFDFVILERAGSRRSG